MRQISSAASQALHQQYGSEPIFIVGIAWNRRNYQLYCDKTLFDENMNPVVMGKILNISNIESILNIAGNQTSVSIDVTLDDSDKHFLDLMDNTDIHMVPCKLFQYFEGLPLADMFELFEGQIVSEIIWSDKDKTLKFSMVTVFQNYEAGFSPEEGDVADLRENLVGKAWPMGFGTPIKAPAVRITDIPVGVTTEPMGFHDPWLNAQIGQLTPLLADLLSIAYFYIFAALQAYNSEEFEIGDQMTDLANEALLAYDAARNKISDLQGILNSQLQYEKKSAYVLTDYPINLKGIFEVGSVYLVGEIRVIRQGGAVVPGVAQFRFTGPYHSVDFQGFSPTRAQIQASGPGPTQIGEIRLEPASSMSGDGPVARQVTEFVYIEAGSTIRFLGNYPVRHVVNIIPSHVRHVYANRTFEGYTRRFRVPKSYYRIKKITVQSTKQLPNRQFEATVVELFRPLSTLLNQRWDDELFVTYDSSVGDSFQAIVTYIVRTFSLYDVDESINTIPPFRLNFVVNELKDVLTLIKEICFQCKTAVTLKNGKFHFIYLPRFTTPVSIITLGDIIEESLEFSFLPTEDVITKMIGTWRIDLSDDKMNRVVIRYNTNKYGTFEETVDFYCFNVQKAVEASMSFWLYRKGNSWKQLKIQVPLKFITLENYDIVQVATEVALEYGINQNQAFYATVLEVQYNSDTNIISLTLELPIKLGENLVDPNYWPSGGFVWLGNTISQIFNGILPPKLWDGISYTPLAQLRPVFISQPGSGFQSIGVTDVIFDTPHQSLNLPNEWNFDMSTQNPPNVGLGRFSPSPVFRDIGGTLGDYIAPKVNIPGNLVRTDSLLPGIPPRFPLLYGEQAKAQQQQAASSQGNVYIGYVNDGKSNNYKVTVYPKGLEGPAALVSVIALGVDPKDTIPKGTAVIIIQTTRVVKQGSPAVSTYYMIPPVWS